MVTDLNDMKRVVDDVREEIIRAKGTRIWDDYINALRLISEVIFTRGSGFVLELIQNAEDAGAGLEGPGMFEIHMNDRRVKVVHNGRGFTPENVKAICGIQSSKKPERGTLGYLGIGFKSVFKITDSPEIYSNGFRFKFDRQLANNPRETPWHVLPYWIPEPSETIDDSKTTIILPFRGDADKRAVSDELGKIGTQLFLFLSWLRQIEIHDEFSHKHSRLQHSEGEKDGIAVFHHDGQQHKFRVFRKTCNVPPEIASDRLTQEYRAKVTSRQVTVAFALDNDGNLEPTQAGAMYGGVYSFAPLSEASSGAKFPIQADFLVQPGRGGLNNEAEWNHWLVRELANLCADAIRVFVDHPTWEYQVLPMFEFTKVPGTESYQKLFGPELIGPTESLIQTMACVPTIGGGLALPSEIVKLSENWGDVQELVDSGVLLADDLAFAFTGDHDLKIADARALGPFRTVDRLDLLGNEELLNNFAKGPDGPGQFRKLYLWLFRHPRWTKSSRGNRYQESYVGDSIVLTANGELKHGREVWLPDVQASPSLAEMSNTLQRTRAILHPQIMLGAADDSERAALRGFLTGRTGVQLLDAKVVVVEALLPRITTKTARPSPEDLLRDTATCMSILGKDLPRETELWVLTKDGDVRPAKEVLLSTEYGPSRRWEGASAYLPALYFLSPRYLNGSPTAETVTLWREFFKNGGVKESPEDGVQEFAVAYTKRKLPDLGYAEIEPVEKRNFGYDLEAVSPAHEKVRIEVKGQSVEEPVTLTRNETEAADRDPQDNFHLCVVCAVPDSPALYMVQNPSKRGKKQSVTVPVDVWKTARIP